jgi:hypothetical protein
MNNGSIVDYLGSKGQASDFNSRSTLAKTNGISNYTGTAEQNTQLLGLLQAPRTTPGVTVPTKIPTQAINTTGAPSITVPVPGVPTAGTILNGTVGGVMAPSAPVATAPESDRDRLRRETMEAIKSYTDPSSGYSAKSQSYATEAGLAEKTAKLNKLDVQDISLQNELAKFKEKTINENPQGYFGGGAEQVISANDRAVSRQRTDLAIEKLALQGDITAATALVKQRLDAEFEPIKQKIEYNKEALSLLNEDLSDSEKAALTAQTKTLETKAADLKSYQSISDEASTAGAPIAVINNAAKLYSSGDRAGALSILAPYVKSTGEQNLTAGLTPAQGTMFNSLVSGYEKSPLVAAYDRTVVLRNTINSIKKNPSDSAQQLNLAYAYIQALDTYQSSVREGELANLNSVDSKIGSLSNSIAKLTNGQVVRPEVAIQIAKAAEDIVKAIEQGAKAKQKDYKSRANVLGLGSTWDQYVGGTSANSSSPTSSQGQGVVTVKINGKSTPVNTDW